MEPSPNRALLAEKVPGMTGRSQNAVLMDNRAWEELRKMWNGSNALIISDFLGLQTYRVSGFPRVI
jgi:hypothetical protein